MSKLPLITDEIQHEGKTYKFVFVESEGPQLCDGCWINENNSALCPLTHTCCDTVDKDGVPYNLIAKLISIE